LEKCLFLFFKLQTRLFQQYIPEHIADLYFIWIKHNFFTKLYSIVFTTFQKLLDVTYIYYMQVAVELGFWFTMGKNIKRWKRAEDSQHQDL